MLILAGLGLIAVAAAVVTDFGLAHSHYTDTDAPSITI